jgi:hypothetical protein
MNDIFLFESVAASIRDIMIALFIVVLVIKEWD